ncbi:MAG: hypothetical protein QQW96_23365 [Tychonema bourrellyi B0820]|nr:hypothetical protein [Tychonema bourrellyi B0820]
MNLLVEQASWLLLTMLQDLKSEFSCGTGILPVADNSARSQL